MPIKNTLAPVGPPILAIPSNTPVEGLVPIINDRLLKLQQPPAVVSPWPPHVFLCKDTTVGNDIADHQVIIAAGVAQRVIGTLRKAISADLVVRINVSGSPCLTMRIPMATLVNSVLVSKGFAITQLKDLQVTTWDVISSDGSTDKDGVASFIFQYGAAAL